ncbi:helix-turn-helix domain-containing protein [Alteromonas sp. 14N.309.X.WAT.G.H12]|uniref:helix-turn-helix domain-containing protein n=1 Tax=Alteromonas sp. 14N.309.X.WAT.G.H12 TaxID=3120824 RepID=UPI002FD5EBC2
MTVNYSKTKVSYYRRLYVAFLIDSGSNTLPALLEATEMHRRALQETLKALSDLDVIIESRGGTKNACYKVESWGAIDKMWIKTNLQHIKDVLERA